jgi:dienelactone hydrolase
MNYLRGILLAFLGLLIISCTTTQSEKKIDTQKIVYEGDGISMTGFYAYDASKEGKRPGILIVHEWWGHNDYARKRAKMLAELDYSAFAVDMYGDGKKAEHPDDAGKFAGAVMQNIDGAKARFLAALDILKSQPATDKEHVAAIGYCFGGGVVLHMARMGVVLDGVVSFHGSLGTEMPAKLDAVKAQILVCNGADDQFVTQEQIDNFKAEMENANVNYTFVSYPSAVHSFTNPAADSLARKFNMPIGYNKAADEKSWSDMLKFFNKIFKSKS